MSWASDYYGLPRHYHTQRETDSWVKHSKNDFTPFDGDSAYDKESYERNHGQGGHYFEIMCAVGAEYTCKHKANLVNSYAPRGAKESAMEVMVSNYKFNQEHWKMVGTRGDV